MSPPRRAIRRQRRSQAASLPLSVSPARLPVANERVVIRES